MRPVILASPGYQADPPPDCLTEAAARRPKGRVKGRAYWSLVLRGLSSAELQLAEGWLMRARSRAAAEASDRPRSRSRRPEPRPAGRAERAAPPQGRPSQAERAAPPQVRPSQAKPSRLEPTETPVARKPEAKRSPKSRAKPPLAPEVALPPGPLTLPAAGTNLLLVSKARLDAGMDVECAWTVDCQCVWEEMDEELAGHIGLHPAALTKVARRLGPVLSGAVMEAVAAQGTPAAPGCLQFECEDGRRASVAVACLVAHLLAALGHPFQVMHLGLEYDSHQESCPACSGLVPEDAAEAVLGLWRDLPLD